MKYFIVYPVDIVIKIKYNKKGLKSKAMNFYISDTHFGHKNVIKFDDRPFDNVTQMEEIIVTNWNKTVHEKDTVYILGDFCWSKKSSEWKRILDELNGYKILIRGNHDSQELLKKIESYFVDIADYAEIVDEQYNVIMSHYPILAYKHNYDPNTIMLHGHVHNSTKEAFMINEFVKSIRAQRVETYDNRGQIINVGCMMPWMNYTPRSIKELVSKLDKEEVFL